MTTVSATPNVQTSSETLAQVHRARQGLLVFAVFLIPLSVFGYWFNIKYPELPLILPTLPLMLAPGLASILTRLLRREGFADVSFRLRGNRMRSAILLAFGLPLVVGTIAYGFAYLTGLAQFDPPPFPVAAGSPLAQFALIMAFAGTVAVLMSLPTTAGEEIGWRGYLLPRMIEARIPQPIMLTSLIWGAWHLPIVFAGVFATSSSHLISAVGLMVSTLALGYILARLRLTTGSVWPAVFGHAAWNAFINGGFTFVTQDRTDNIWIGETGIVVSVTLILAAIVISRTWKPTEVVTA